MKTVKFDGFGLNRAETTVIASKILSWYRVSYNGLPGTVICLEGGKEILTEDPEHVVESKVNEALKDEN